MQVTFPFMTEEWNGDENVCRLQRSPSLTHFYTVSKRTFPFARCNQQWHLGDLCSPRLLQLAILSFSAQGFHILFLLHSLSNYRLLPEYQHVHLHMHFSLLFPLSPSASLREATHRGAWRTCAAGPLCSRKAIPITPNTTTTQFSSLAKASAPQGCRVSPGGRLPVTIHTSQLSVLQNVQLVSESRKKVLKRSFCKFNI